MDAMQARGAVHHLRENFLICKASSKIVPIKMYPRHNPKSTPRARMPTRYWGDTCRGGALRPLHMAIAYNYMHMHAVLEHSKRHGAQCAH